MSERDCGHNGREVCEPDCGEVVTVHYHPCRECGKTTGCPVPEEFCSKGNPLCHACKRKRLAAEVAVT